MGRAGLVLVSLLGDSKELLVQGRPAHSRHETKESYRGKECVCVCGGVLKPGEYSHRALPSSVFEPRASLSGWRFMPVLAVLSFRSVHLDRHRQLSPQVSHSPLKRRNPCALLKEGNGGAEKRTPELGFEPRLLDSKVRW